MLNRAVCGWGIWDSPPWTLLAPIRELTQYSARRDELANRSMRAKRPLLPRFVPAWLLSRRARMPILPLMSPGQRFRLVSAQPQPVPCRDPPGHSSPLRSNRRFGGRALAEIWRSALLLLGSRMNGASRPIHAGPCAISLAGRSANVKTYRWERHATTSLLAASIENRPAGKAEPCAHLPLGYPLRARRRTGQEKLEFGWGRQKWPAGDVRPTVGSMRARQQRRVRISAGQRRAGITKAG